MCAYNHIHVHTHLHTTHACTHIVHMYTRSKHTATHACTHRITHNHTCTHTIIWTYTVTTHTHTNTSHTSGTHNHKQVHTHTPFGGLWSSLPMNPGILGHLKVRGAYVQLITKPTGLGSGPLSQGLSPSSLQHSSFVRRKVSKEVLKAGNGFLSFHMPCATPNPGREDVAPVSLTSSGGKCGGGWSHGEGAARGSPASWGPQKKGFRVRAAV